MRAGVIQHQSHPDSLARVISWAASYGGRILVIAGAVCLLGGVAARRAGAAVTHEYLPAVSQRLTEGVPGGSGAPLPGPLADVTAMSGDGGHLWVAEFVEQQGVNESRVDEFDTTTGDFLHQLVAEAGVSLLTDGVAVGHATGEEEVYVGAGTSSGHVVAVYDSAEKLQAVWSGAHTANKSFGGEGAGQIRGVGVDGSSSITDPAAGDVYVVTSQTAVGSAAFNVVDVFAPSAGGQEPVQTAAEIRGTCKVAGPCAGAEVVPFAAPRGIAVSGFNGDVLVTDGVPGQCKSGTSDECAVDVFGPVAGMPGVYSYLFKITGAPSTGAFKVLASVAVNAQNGNIFVAEKKAGVVDEYSATGEFLGALRGTPTGPSGTQRPFNAPHAVAVDPVTGRVFVADHSGEKETAGIMDAFGPDLVVPDVVVVEPPASVGPHGATLRGHVDPDGEPEARCEFEYGTSTAYGMRSACSPAEVPSAMEVLSEPLSKLAPDTTYHYRLDATNPNGTNTGECPADCGEFTTLGPGIRDEAAEEVSATAATVRAAINPNGKATSWYVQYSLTSTSGCETSPESCVSAPASPGLPLGAGPEPIVVSRHLGGLSPGTVYHYRFVAVSAVQGGGPEVFPGSDQTFTTQSSGSGSVLADGREWELVSPADKHGGVPLPIQETGLLQASSSGQAISYRSTAPTEPGVAGYSETEQVLSQRGGGGWVSEDISLPHSSAVGSGVGEGSEYRLFSEDLSAAVVDPIGEFTPLAPESSLPETELTPYVRHDASCKAEPGACYRPLLLGCPALGEPCPAAVEENADVPAGTHFGLTPNGGRLVAVHGASRDLARVVVSSQVPLLAPPKPGEKSFSALYEWAADRPAPAALQLVSELPGGQLAPGEAQLGYDNFMARNAVSGDGSRVFWTEFKGHLYLRDLPSASTVQIDSPESVCLEAGECGGGSPAPVFQFAAQDGRRVLFTDTQRLTADSSEVPGQADLYACEVIETPGGSLKCVLSDVTPAEPGSGNAAEVQGSVLGASQDGTTVYFVANGVLAPGASQGSCDGSTPPPGATCNLYGAHYDGSKWLAPKFITELSGDDWSDWAGAVGKTLNAMTSRVSSDGRFVALMSDRSLTGYDNHDAVTGRPDEEVYLYDAASDGGAGGLVCASCDPTGARPVGVEYSKLREGLAGVQSAPVWSEEQEIAANVPAWTPFTLKEARHQSRYLSDSGRLFFNSNDGLSPRDLNGNQDVYEFEPAGVGNCSGVSAGFDPGKDGCVNLISSGLASGESGFLDAGESGEDVFFLTAERLVPGDRDTAVDVYDAHVCSTGAPCFTETEHPAPCGSPDECRSSSGVSGSVTSPPTSTSTGEGNLPPGSSSTGPRKLTRAQKLAAALKACRKDRRKHKRLACVRSAQKRYGTHRKAKGSRAYRGVRGGGR